MMMTTTMVRRQGKDRPRAPLNEPMRPTTRQRAAHQQLDRQRRGRCLALARRWPCTRRRFACVSPLVRVQSRFRSLQGLAPGASEKDASHHHHHHVVHEVTISEQGTEIIMTCCSGSKTERE